MLAEWLPSGSTALATRDGSLTWAELLTEISQQAERLGTLRGQRVGVLLAPTPTMIATLLACEHAGVHAFLIAADVTADQVEAWSDRFSLAAVIDSSSLTATPYLSPDHASPDAINASAAVTILTSGTTGEPKAVEHTWTTLTRPARKTDGEAPTWLLTFRPHLYAGLQVMMQCLLNQGTLVIPQAGDTADEVATLAAKFAVNFASATPSYWRWLVTFATHETIQQMALKQITLGGEAVDQATLDTLHAKFPQTRLVHIYATTELGRCFSVTDGLSGFPSKFLSTVSADGIEMKIDEGELVVRSANAMNGYDQTEGESPQEHWFPTGDLVQVEGDRVHFVGRKTDMINVGGNKVYPLEVETTIRSVDGVADVRVYGQESSMLGQLVKCDIVVADGFDEATVEANVRKQCLAELNSYQLPRFVDFVADIPKTAAGKTARN